MRKFMRWDRPWGKRKNIDVENPSFPTKMMYIHGVFFVTSFCMFTGVLSHDITIQEIQLK